MISHMRSRVTLATTDAAAIDNDSPSPPTIFSIVHGMPLGAVLPSIST
jgi:hypothetical protein